MSRKFIISTSHHRHKPSECTYYKQFFLLLYKSNQLRETLREVLPKLRKQISLIYLLSISKISQPEQWFRFILITLYYKFSKHVVITHKKNISMLFKKSKEGFDSVNIFTYPTCFVLFTAEIVQTFSSTLQRFPSPASYTLFFAPKFMTTNRWRNQYRSLHYCFSLWRIVFFRIFSLLYCPLSSITELKRKCKRDEQAGKVVRLWH
jgi:hypothetical protein